jgi:transcriptional regulator with XRE-family HTH domain
MEKPPTKKGSRPGPKPGSKKLSDKPIKVRPPSAPDRATIEREAEELVERMRFVLRRRVRASSRTLREFDERLGVSTGYTSHLLQGDLHLQCSHIAAVAEALDVPQRELYAEVFPEVAREPSLVSEADPPPAWWPRDDELRGLVAEILDELTEPIYMDGDTDELPDPPAGRRGSRRKR